MSLGEHVQEAPFQRRPGVGKRSQPFKVHSPIASPDPRQRSASSQIEQRLPHGVAIEHQRLVLIAEAEQALIAGGLTVGLSIVAVFIEVTTSQGRRGDTRDSIRLLDQPAQHAGPALRCLIKQDRPMCAIANPLRAKFALLKLKHLLATTLQGILQRCLQPRIVT